jgi:hypothetical protein
VGGKCHTLGWPIASLYTHYAVPAHKTFKTRYIAHISYTTSYNPHVAYAIHTLNNCHEYDPVDEIMRLAKTLHRKVKE